jgi:replicative DNA helicase
MLCHHAAKCLEQGKNVLFVTLEMSAEAISQRIDANLMQVNINTLYSGTKDAYLNKFNKIKQKTLGQLYIKEYPISTAHAGNFNALIDELAIKKSFHPDIIIIDYLNICASSTNSSNSNSYERVKCIAEQLRSLAQKRNLPVLSAIQLNRSGSGNTSPDMADIADSYALAMVADFILALVTNESLAELEQILCCQIKNRYADVGKPKKFILGLDKPKMTFYDVNVEYNDSGDKSEFIDVEGREVVISLNKNKKQVSRYIE